MGTSDSARHAGAICVHTGVAAYHMQEAQAPWARRKRAAQLKQAGGRCSSAQVQHASTEQGPDYLLQAGLHAAEALVGSARGEVLLRNLNDASTQVQPQAELITVHALGGEGEVGIPCQKKDYQTSDP